jgi:hypothetical protein
MISFDDLNVSVNIDTSAIENSINLIKNDTSSLNDSVQSISDTLTWLIYESSQYTDSTMAVSDLVILRSNTSKLSADKLETSAFNDFTSTFSPKYQINMSDVKSDYNLECLYNLTGGSYTVSKQNSKHYSFGGLGIDSFSYYENSNCTFEGTINSFLNSYMSGGSNTFSNIKIPNLNNMRMRRVWGEYASINFNSDSLYSCRISNHGNYNNNTFAGRIYLTNTGSINNNTFKDDDIISMTLNGTMRSNIVSSAAINIVAEGLGFNYNSGSDGSTNRVSIKDKKPIAVAYNSFSRGYLDAENADFYSNTFTDLYTLKVSSCSANNISTITNLIMNSGFDFDKNTVSSLHFADLKLSHFRSNDVKMLDFLDMYASTSFINNTFTGTAADITLTNFLDNSLNIDELNVDFRITNPSFTGNSILVDTFSVNRFLSEYFTNNILNVGNYLDFNYGSSEVYDASLNFLLSDYVDESKVLGKYNLVPYIRSLSESISTMTGGGGEGKYQYNFTDVSSISNVDYENLYGLTGSISGIQFTNPGLKITGPNELNSCTLTSMSDCAVVVASLVNNSISNVSNLEMKVNRFLNSNIFKDVKNMNLTQYIISSNSFANGWLISNNGLNCLNNTFSSNRIIHFEGNDVKNNQISSASFFNVLANNLEENTLSSISNMIMNGNECYLNNARNVKCGNCFANVIENNNFVTITNLNQTANKIDSNLYSYVSTLTIDAASIRGNYVNGENIDVSGSYITKNTFSGFQNAIINVNSVFSSNSIGNGTYFNLNNYNTSVNVSGNSFYVDELKMNRIYTDYFTKNTISVNKMLDFDYGSSNVYDASLNYLLSDYVDESKVLGKYNLVPYVRSLMNGGGNGNISICAFAKNLRNQIILFPDNIDTFNLNINFSNTDTGPLLDGITFSNKTINKFLVNNWNLTSGGLRSIMSMKNVSINTFWYDADWNAYIHTGSLFSCSTSNGLTINEVNYTHNTHYTSSMDTINEIYPICSNATFGTVNMSFFQNQFAYAPIYNNTIKQLNMSGSTPVLAGLKCSISTFNYKDFINSTHIDSTNPPFKSCTFGNILFSPSSTISTSRIFNQCSIKNANVVCTPLMWDMSSATYRAWMAEAIAGFNNTTTDVVPMSYVVSWPN